ncbi:unnamed protein product [Dovyalis caffra]|uniref:Rx N-terminal domain-containing protein n=1 Tax=Dovyalis caffra TaxID=77055 RepID=A0AAV1S040_9ROSI|nr:unnamed protein product [Dovyalis caffra]
MAGFLMITYIWEQTLMKVNSLEREEMSFPFRLGGLLAAVKGVLTDIQAMLQGVEERLLPTKLFLELHQHVDLLEVALERFAFMTIRDKVRLSIIDDSNVQHVSSIIRNHLDTVHRLLDRMRISLEEIRESDEFKKQEVGLSGLPLILHSEGCHKLISLLMPSVKTFTSLEYLRLEGFPDLLSIPDLQNLSLKGLAIKHCPNLAWIASLQHLTALEDLRIEVCPNLESIPSVGGLSAFRQLVIWVLKLKPVFL